MQRFSNRKGEQDKEHNKNTHAICTFINNIHAVHDVHYKTHTKTGRRKGCAKDDLSTI